MLINVNWLIITVFSLVFAFITVMPELYAMWKAPDKWTPVSSPPHSLSDNYHYFSILNLIHRRFLNLTCETKLSYVPLSTTSKFMIVGYLINLLPYHMGYLVQDRRLGVVFVRIWNKLLLCISVCFFTNLFFISFGIKSTTSLLIFTFVLFYILFPGPFGLNAFKSIAWGINNKRHIYDQGETNYFSRAMFSETSGPLLLGIIALLMIVVSINNPLLITICGLVSILFLFFFHIPSTLYYSTLVFFLLLLNKQFIYANVICFFMIALIGTYKYIMLHSGHSKELYSFKRNHSLLAISRYKLKLIISYLLPSIILVFIIYTIPDAEFLILYIVSSLFVFIYLLEKQYQQFYRIFGAASIIPFQLISTAVCISIIVPFFPSSNLLFFISLQDLIVWGGLMFLTIILIYFYHMQSIFLFDTGTTHFSENICFERDIFSKSSKIKGAKSRIIATNSTELAYSFDLFGGDESFLRNYSIQPFGYRQNLHSILTNFKLLDYSFNECKDLLTVNVNVRDWYVDDKRPFPKNSILAELCYVYTLQYMATHRDYNIRLIMDGMYNNGCWTDKYKKLLKETWDSIDISIFNNVHFAKIEKPY